MIQRSNLEHLNKHELSHESGFIAVNSKSSSMTQAETMRILVSWGRKDINTGTEYSCLMRSSWVLVPKLGENIEMIQRRVSNLEHLRKQELGSNHNLAQQIWTQLTTKRIVSGGWVKSRVWM